MYRYENIRVKKIITIVSFDDNDDDARQGLVLLGE